MNLKRLFGVLFITIMLLSMPCAYATDDSSDNGEFIFKDYTIGNSFVVSVITECSGIISLYKSNLMKRYNGANGKKQVVLQEIRKREHYEKPSIKRKKKAEAARKRKY